MANKVPLHGVVALVGTINFTDQRSKFAAWAQNGTHVTLQWLLCLAIAVVVPGRIQIKLAQPVWDEDFLPFGIDEHQQSNQFQLDSPSQVVLPFVWIVKRLTVPKIETSSGSEAYNSLNWIIACRPLSPEHCHRPLCHSCPRSPWLPSRRGHRTSLGQQLVLQPPGKQSSRSDGKS